MATFTARTEFQGIFQQANYGSASLTPGVLVANTVNTSNTITVPNAAVGDIVDVSAPASIGGIMMQGEVTAANTVTIKFLSAATTAPPTGIYKVITYPLTANFSA